MCSIISMFDKHCSCDVRFPFICTEFLYNFKKISYSDVLRKFMNKADISVFNNITGKETSDSDQEMYRVILCPRKDF